MGSDADTEFTLVSAHTSPGLAFIRFLQCLNRPFAVITHNQAERLKMENEFGVKRALSVDMEATRVVPEIRVGNVFLFESSLPLTCSYVQLTRPWTSKPIYVVTEDPNYRRMYKQLGADFVVHTRSQDVTFLLDLGK